MTDPGTPFGPRRRNPVRGWLLLALYLALIGLRAWGIFSSGHTVSGWFFLGVFVGLPTVTAVVAGVRKRRGITPKPRTAAQRQLVRVAAGLALLTAVAVIAVVSARPVDRVATGFGFGIAFVLVALVIWASIRSPRD